MSKEHSWSRAPSKSTGTGRSARVFWAAGLSLPVFFWLLYSEASWLVCVVGSTIALAVIVSALSVAAKGLVGILYPSSTIATAIALIFGVRPLLMDETTHAYFFGINVANYKMATAYAGLLFMIAFSLTLWAIGGKVRKAPPQANQSNGRRVCDEAAGARLNRGILLTGVAGVLVIWVAGLMALTGRIDILARIAEGRSESLSAVLGSTPQSYHLIPVAITISLCLIRMRDEAESRYSTGLSLYWLALVVVSLYPTVGMGARRLVIPGIIVASIVILQIKRFPMQNIVATIAGLVGLSAAMVVPFVRSAGNRLEGESLIEAIYRDVSLNGMRGVLERFFVSYDTEMFSMVGALLHTVGYKIEFGMGKGLLRDFFVTPLPSELSPYALRSDEVLASVTGAPCYEGPCPVPSVVGVAYADLGLFGVVVAAIAMAVLSIYTGRNMHVGSRWLPLALTLAGFAPVAARGNTVVLLSLALQAAVMVWVLVACATRAERWLGKTVRLGRHTHGATTHSRVLALSGRRAA